MKYTVDEIKYLLEHGNFEDVSGRSCASTYRIENDLYLKTDEAGKLEHEARMGAIFHKLGLGPEVVEFVSDGERDYMLTAGAKGKDLTDCLADKELVFSTLAAALANLEAFRQEDMPVSSKSMEYGKIYNSNQGELPFNERTELSMFHVGSREEAFSIIRDYGPLSCEDTVHGDLCLPNVLSDNGHFSSLIDFSMAGKGDRYMDLYLALWSLSYNYGSDEAAKEFIAFYGENRIDMEKLRVIHAYEAFDII